MATERPGSSTGTQCGTGEPSSADALDFSLSSDAACPSDSSCEATPSERGDATTVQLARSSGDNATQDDAGNFVPVPALYSSLWSLILFRLAELGDVEHFATVERNERNFAAALQSRPNEQTVIGFDFAMPRGFLGAFRLIATARLVCKGWRALLESNTWWYTFWTKRSIADIRCFKPARVTWWEVAERFHTMREEARAKLEVTHVLERKAYVSANNRGLAWSLLREFRCALIDYALSEVNCIDEDTRASQVFRMNSNVAVVYIKIADFPRALACANRCIEAECAQNPASALNNRSVALIHLNRFAEAKSDLERSMEFDKTLPNSRLHMAYCMYREQNYEECLDYCEKALTLSGGDYPAVHLMKSHALDALGRVDEAQAVMNHCVEQAWEVGPYKAIFVHQLPIKHPNFSW